MGIVGSHEPMIRANLVPPFPISLGQDLERTSYMAKHLSLLEVKEKFNLLWGDKYTYDLITEDNYVNTRTKVPIVCKEHGVFYQSPHSHLSGYGCSLCGRKRQGGGIHLKNRKLVCGVGINDSDTSTTTHGSHNKSYSIWKAMINRCYGKRSKENSYRQCSVCSEWLTFSNFEKWFSIHYIEGYHLDKDIMEKGNKVYSPLMCNFIPPEINTLLTKHDSTRGEYPIGVSQSYNGKYRSIIRINGKYVEIGVFDSPELAFKAYKQTKESHIKNMAEQYYNNGKINERTYLALLQYTVEITD